MRASYFFPSARWPKESEEEALVFSEVERGVNMLLLL
jgi:hypothetical protein